MPSGANPAGSLGSVNEPARAVIWKFRSRTSICPLRKLAASRKFPELLLISASPLYTALFAELSKATTALFAPVQFATMPSSVSKMKAPPLKSVELLATVPVGHPGLHGFTDALGMPTTSDCLLPRASYKVEVPPLLFAIQNGLPGRKEIPQGFES